MSFSGGSERLTRKELAWELAELFDDLSLDDVNEMLAKNVPLETLRFFASYAEDFADVRGQAQGRSLQQRPFLNEPLVVDRQGNVHRWLLTAEWRGLKRRAMTASIRVGRRLARSTRTHSVAARQMVVASAGRTTRVSRQDLTRRMSRTHVATTSSSSGHASAR